MIGCLPTQALEFLAVFVYATHATQAIAFEMETANSKCLSVIIYQRIHFVRMSFYNATSVRQSQYFQIKNGY